MSFFNKKTKKNNNQYEDTNFETLNLETETTEHIQNIEQCTSLDKLGISYLKKQPILTLINKEKTKLQRYIPMLEYSLKNNIQEIQKIKCFGCHRNFNSFPIGIPINYTKPTYDSENNIISEEIFDFDGIVCSFNCMVSVSEDISSPVYKNTKYLISKFYKSIFSHYPTDKIIRSPDWRLRKEYGGILSDEEFEKILQIINFTDSHQVEKIIKISNNTPRIFNVNENNK